MKTSLLNAIFLTTVFCSSLSSWAADSAPGESPCKSKMEAKHTARKAVHECLMAWGRDVKPGDPDPTDDCSAKMAEFVQASKNFKACRVESQKEREAKKKH